MALTWHLHRSPNTLPIPGTGTISHVDANNAASRLLLSADEVRQLTDSLLGPLAVRGVSPLITIWISLLTTNLRSRARLARSYASGRSASEASAAAQSTDQEAILPESISTRTGPVS